MINNVKCQYFWTEIYPQIRCWTHFCQFFSLLTSLLPYINSLGSRDCGMTPWQKSEALWRKSSNRCEAAHWDDRVIMKDGWGRPSPQIKVAGCLACCTGRDRTEQDRDTPETGLWHNLNIRTLTACCWRVIRGDRFLTCSRSFIDFFGSHKQLLEKLEGMRGRYPALDEGSLP